MDEKEAEAIKRKLVALEKLMLRHAWTPMTPAPDEELAEEAAKEAEECREKQSDSTTA